MSNDKDTPLAMVPWIILIAVPLWAFQAWVALQLWRWFVLPVFPTAPTPSLWVTVGLLFALRYVVNGTPSYIYDPRPWQERVGYAIVAPLFWGGLMWVTGAALHALVY